MCGILHIIIFITNIFVTCGIDNIDNSVNQYDLNISKDVAKITNIAVKNSNIDPIDLSFGNQLLSQLSHHQILHKNSRKYLPLDPVQEDPWFCKRNFTFPCPADFTLLTNTGNETGEKISKCVPKNSYIGNCGSEDFSKTSVEYKLQWSKRCSSNWPCNKDYKPDYSIHCPENWKLDNGKCLPTNDYIGPCGQPINFSNFNKRQREEWSRNCHSFWPDRSQSNIERNDVNLHKTTGIPIDSIISLSIVTLPFQFIEWSNLQ